MTPGMSLALIDRVGRAVLLHRQPAGGGGASEFAHAVHPDWGRGGPSGLGVCETINRVPGKGMVTIAADGLLTLVGWGDPSPPGGVDAPCSIESARVAPPPPSDTPRSGPDSRPISAGAPAPFQTIARPAPWALAGPRRWRRVMSTSSGDASSPTQLESWHLNRATILYVAVDPAAGPRSSRL